MKNKTTLTFNTRSGNTLTIEYDGLLSSKVARRGLPCQWASEPTQEDLQDFQERGKDELDEQASQFLYST